MSEFDAPRSRPEARRVEGVRTVIAGLTRHILHTPIDAASDHYRTPEERSAPVQPELPLIERPEAAQLGRTALNRWDSLGVWED